MKKKVMLFIASMGCIASYAGNTQREIVYKDASGNLQKECVGSKKTMYIKSGANLTINPADVQAAVLNKFGLALPFQLIAQDYYDMSESYI